MNALFLILFIVGIVLALLLVSILKSGQKCPHEFGPPCLVEQSGWYEHKFTMPHEQLRGKVFHVYRRDNFWARRCRHCGELEGSHTYDQKPHESDTNVVPPTPENFQPETAPGGLTDEQIKQLRK